MTPQDDSEQTLIAPRFDPAEEQEARPVVPLAEVRVHEQAHWRKLASYLRPVQHHSWPLALLVACLLTVGVVGATALIRHRQRAQAEATTTQPTAPAVSLPAGANQPAPASNNGSARVRNAPAAVAPRTAARPAVEQVAPDNAEASARFSDSEASDEDKHEHKREKQKHKEHGDEDEGFVSLPRNKKEARRAAARLVDTIIDHDH